MWHSLDEMTIQQTAYTQSLYELAEHTARRLMLMVTGLYLLFHIVITAHRPLMWGEATWCVTLIVVSAGIVGYRLLPHYPRLALLLWLIGLAAAVTGALYLFQQPEVAFFYVLLPLIAIATTDWSTVLFISSLVAGLIWWLVASALLSTGYGLAILLSCGITGLIGWGTIDGLATALTWTLAGFAQARTSTDEARRHRAQLTRLVKELDQAYYQLERSNAALVAARHAAEEAERFKTEFVTNVSHELRTPLNLIVGYSELMMTSPESYGGAALPGPYRVDLNAVYHSAQHLLALVDDILDLARIEVGKLALAREEVEIGWLVHDTANLVRDYITAKGLDFQVEITPGLPCAWIDRLRIRQVLLNLLVNAARHTEQGFVRVCATCQSDAQVTEIVLQVQDSGRGIPKQDLQRVFEEFRSIEEPLSQWHSGAGLGLPISKKFVELHQGRMGVESTYGEGASFWFTVPVATFPQMNPVVASGPHYQPLVRLKAVERIIILLHPDPAVITLLKRYLTGYQVIGMTDHANDLVQAVTLAHEVKALAIITSQPVADARLPDHAEKLLIIQCALPDTRQVVSQLGVDHVLVKPVGRQELLAAVDALDRPLDCVLIVDDDPAVVRLFRRILRARVPVENCLEAYNGQEALSLLRQTKPDLILLDLIMPEVDGRTLLAQLAADPTLAAIPVILISARGQDQANLHVAGPVQILRPAGHELGEVIQLLTVTLDALAGEWQHLAANAPATATTPVDLPALADRLPPQATAPTAVHSTPSR